MGLGRFVLTGWSRRRSFAGLMAVLGLGLIVWAVSSPGSANASSTQARGDFPAVAKASSGSECGKEAVTLPTQTQSAFKALSTSVKDDFNNFPFPVLNSPWSSHKKVKGPWKIGLISTPTGSSINDNAITEI